ncbi:hypothetical protein [Ferroplasma sp. Type II]|uniref:hypothetical protein n=1 Tax=Ferroplasma sp. Type II TaxID=261388 RepID=UPI0025B9015E|nr:hypothetical protein [Ferroplasma sp. Type II]
MFNIFLDFRKANDFNYTLTYSGFSMIKGMITEDIEKIPQVIIQINKTKSYGGKNLIEAMSNLFILSNLTNNSPEH